MSSRWWVVAFVVGVAAWGRLAHADKVDDLSRQLRGDPDYKVRLSAALNLGKLGDRRGVPALIDGLEDTDRTVRGVAAAALGKLVDASVAADVAARAIAALERRATAATACCAARRRARCRRCGRRARGPSTSRRAAAVRRRGVRRDRPHGDATKKAPRRCCP